MDTIDNPDNRDELQRMLAVAIEQSPVTIVITDPTGKIQHANPKFTQITGYSLSEVKGSTPRIFKSGHTSDKEYVNLWQTISSGQTWRGEFLNRKKNGEYFWERATISPAFGDHGNIEHFIAVKEDISELKRFERNLELQTYYDNLTGLPNRVLFNKIVQEHIQKAEQLAIAVINLDGFQKVNISLGHAGGDLLIQQLALRLKKLLQPQDSLARLTADEFALAMPNRNMSTTYLTTQRLTQLLSEPFSINGQNIFVTASIGLAFTPDDGENVETLQRNVFSALHRAKEAGGNQICYFQQELNDLAHDLFTKESELRQALQRNELELYYQPQIYNGQILGAEALLRWNSHAFGLVSADQFIPLAEQTGLIVEIGQWVIETACREAASWAEPISISVNISSRQFAAGTLLSVVKNALSGSGLAANRLELEVTESLMQENLDSTTQTLQQLAKLGVGIALDDFGTGYSSLSYLASMPFSVLKLDRSFIRHIIDSERDQKLCRSIISMADTMNFQVVAEGVEERAQLDLLRSWGVQWIQGYYYSPPLPLKDFLQFMASFADSTTSLPCKA